jgi:hypothetical protein
MANILLDNVDDLVNNMQSLNPFHQAPSIPRRGSQSGAGFRGSASQGPGSQPRRQRHHEASAGYLIPPQAYHNDIIGPRIPATSIDPRTLLQAGQGVRRPQTSQSRSDSSRGSWSSYSRSSTESSVLCITMWRNINQLMRGRSRASRQGLRTLKPKEMRGFFKPGRVYIPAQCLYYSHISQVFKAFWTQTTSSNNPFGEMLRFVIVKAHKDHSICL